jgi:predicted secreted hydrolase
MILRISILVFQIINIFILLTSYVLSEGTNKSNEKQNRFSTIPKNLSLEFPLDHGAHDNFRIEWWYLTAILQDEYKTPIGLQWTLFRVALEPNSNKKNWESSQIWMGHAAVTSKEFHLFEEKIARGGVLQAGVTTSPFKAWIDDWYFKGPDWSNLTVSASGDHFNYILDLEAKGPLIKHGENGRSIKSASGQASAYYSQPFFHAKGWIEQNGKRKRVSGTAWADHEWSSQFVADTQKGWDWFSLNFKSGQKLMVFRVREKNKNHFYSGTWINSDGTNKKIKSSDIILEPVDPKHNEPDYILNWVIKIKSLNINIKTEALNPLSKMKTIYPYWEGPILFSGSHTGKGYLEMTGYTK